MFRIPCTDEPELRLRGRIHIRFHVRSMRKGKRCGHLVETKLMLRADAPDLLTEKEVES